MIKCGDNSGKGNSCKQVVLIPSLHVYYLMLYLQKYSKPTFSFYNIFFWNSWIFLLLGFLLQVEHAGQPRDNQDIPAVSFLFPYISSLHIQVDCKYK